MNRRWKKTLIIVSAILTIYVFSFLLLPMKMVILFMSLPPAEITEQDARTFLPPIHGNVEFTKTSTGDWFYYALKTKTLNSLVIWEEIKFWNYWTPTIHSQSLMQDYPFQFQKYLYYPLWYSFGLLVNSLYH
jgi:hypothetical protein